MWNTSSRVLWQRTKHFLCKSGFLYIWLKFDIITLPTYLFWDVEYLHSKNKFSLTLLEQMTCLSWKVALDWRDSNCIKVVLLRWHIKLVPSTKNTGTNRNLSFNYHFVFQQIFDERTLQRGQHKWVFSWPVLSFLDKALHNIPPTWFGYCAVNFQPDFRWLDEEAEVITGDGQSCVKITYICFTSKIIIKPLIFCSFIEYREGQEEITRMIWEMGPACSWNRLLSLKSMSVCFIT